VRLVTFSPAGAPARVGALLGADDGGPGEAVLDLAAALPDLAAVLDPPTPHDRAVPRGLPALLAADPDVLDRVRTTIVDPDPAHRHPLADVRLLAPVPRPGKILCIGYNYRGHAADAVPDPEVPDVFTKPATAVVGPGAPVVLPPDSDEVDYEAELAVVIGRTAHRVDERDALAHVGGYTVLDDVSARDWQRRTSQWGLAKSFDTFCPLGPAVVTPDEVPDPQALRVEARVGGETTLLGSTADMVFPVAFLVAHLSRVMTLEPGDVIATGTPQKLAHVLDRGPRPLRDGDVVEITVGSLGTLRSPVAAAPPR
jgi:2-keto-4-pentenoate hydratase/2-oxohepta-3-ene-1,7-dioic acid hydratase in catechol pathway